VFDASPTTRFEQSRYHAGRLQLLGSLCSSKRRDPSALHGTRQPHVTDAFDRAVLRFAAIAGPSVLEALWQRTGVAHQVLAVQDFDLQEQMACFWWK